MADLTPQFDDLPPGAVPDTVPPSTGGVATQQAPQFTPLPSGAQPDAPPQPYQGRFLPFRTDTSGNLTFDPLHTGITGAAYNALQLPSDVWTGKQETPYSGGTAVPDPGLLDRIRNLAQFIPQTSPIGNRAAPTGLLLKAETDAAYAAARANQVPVPSSAVAAYAQGIQRTLQDPYGLGLTPKTAPKTFDALDDLINPQSPTTNYTVLDATRRQLNAIKSSPSMGDSDSFAAGHAITHLDNLIDAISPEAATARANAAAGFRANAITGDLTQGNTGILEKADTATALRARVRTFLQNENNVRGFSPDEISALNAFAESGGKLPVGASSVGNMLGSGLGKFFAAGAGAVLGSHFGEHGAELGFLGGPWIGEALKGWENARASSQLDAIGAMLRSRSPLGQEYQSNLLTPNPLPYQIAVPSLLSTQPPQQPAAPAQAPGRFPPLPATGPIPAGLLGPWA